MGWISLATEDQLSEAVGLRLLSETEPLLEPYQLLRRDGFGYLRSRMDSWCQLARDQALFLLTDLDRKVCPKELIDDWFRDRACPPNFLFRVAVREVEAWLLADHLGMRTLIGSKGKLPEAPDEIPDPKLVLLGLARLASRTVREDLVRLDGNALRQGVGYNALLCEWVQSSWSPERAAQRSPSLGRTRVRLAELARQVTS
jgi:Domain of unknown function (DUF4276)